jgi:thymidine phosphorylase
VTFALCREMLELTDTRADLDHLIGSGAALEVWNEMVRAQGGDPEAPLPEADERRTIPAPASGFVTQLDARAVGIAAWRLGAGRARKEDPVSASAGVVCLKKIGDEVTEGEPILELHADDPNRFEDAAAALTASIEVRSEAPESAPMVIERIRP